MEPVKIQNQFLRWATSATKDERLQLLKRYLDILPEDELNQVTNIASKAKKRRKRFKVVSAPDSSVSAPDSSVSVPSKKWYEKYQLSDIVSMDVEKVEVPKEGIQNKYDQLAGTVSIVDHTGRPLLSKKIQRPIGSYRVHPIVYKKNGIGPRDLVNGTPLAEVQSDIRKILNGKLVVMLDAEMDFYSLDLPIADFDVFDLVHFWYRGYFSPKGRYYTEKLGLRSLCYHFFEIDVQPEGKPHDATEDAKWTVRLFTEVFPKEVHNEYRVNPHDSNHIKHYKKK